ncbi:hypothetical protein C440_05475 [Haloferax mucosum ATCC BAA-1512]|uniref:JAB domain-containing protein n=1 Tax=Haloferax mucosum ATCC BAA-1512 TaxID=662479 RepID=M0IKX8_9EURY|nr:hypothetical protein C440_05475 [Haloferax mucosum ATCC BAA-1512]
MTSNSLALEPSASTSIRSHAREGTERDPTETVAAFEEAESEDDDIVGFYHSHPDTDPFPSDADREQASWPGYVYLICHPDGRATAHEWNGDEFRALDLEV